MKQLREATATPPVSQWPHWENQLAKARREGMIEGLERALRFVAPFVLQEHSDRIRAEVERLKGGA